MTKQFREYETGMTQIKCGIMLSLVSIGIMAVITTMGGGFGERFGETAGEIERVVGHP